MYQYSLNCIDTEPWETIGNDILKAPTAIFLHQMFPMARIMIKAINKPPNTFNKERNQEIVLKVKSFIFY